MKIQNGVVFGDKELLQVISVIALTDYKLKLLFSNGEERLFDAHHLLEHKVFAPLKNKSFFKSVSVNHGTIWWPGDIDYDPETLYFEGTKVS